MAVRSHFDNPARREWWSVHVEALEWSGMTVRQHAAALAISHHSLRRWRDLLTDLEVPVD